MNVKSAAALPIAASVTKWHGPPMQAPLVRVSGTPPQPLPRRDPLCSRLARSLCCATLPVILYKGATTFIAQFAGEWLGDTWRSFRGSDEASEHTAKVVLDVAGSVCLLALLVPSGLRAADVFHRASGIGKTLARIAAFAPTSVVLGLLIYDFEQLPAIEGLAAAAVIRELLQEAIKVLGEPRLRVRDQDGEHCPAREWTVERDGSLLAILPDAAGAVVAQYGAGGNVDLIAEPAVGAGRVAIAAALRAWFKVAAELARLVCAVTRGGDIEAFCERGGCAAFNREKLKDATALRLDFMALAATISTMARHLPAQGPARELLRISGSLLQAVNEMRSAISKAADGGLGGRSPLSQETVWEAVGMGVLLAGVMEIIVSWTLGSESLPTSMMAVGISTGIMTGWAVERRRERQPEPVPAQSPQRTGSQVPVFERAQREDEPTPGRAPARSRIDLEVTDLAQPASS